MAENGKLDKTSTAFSRPFLLSLYYNLYKKSSWRSENKLSNLFRGGTNEIFEEANTQYSQIFDWMQRSMGSNGNGRT